MEYRKMVTITLYAKQKKRHRCTEQTFGLCGSRQGWDVSKEQHVYYQWNKSPAQVGCMRQVLKPSALGRPREIGWRGRWEGGSAWRIHVNPLLIHFSVWQKPLKYCEVISLQLIKINEKKKKGIPIYQYTNIPIYQSGSLLIRVIRRFHLIATLVSHILMNAQKY